MPMTWPVWVSAGGVAGAGDAEVGDLDPAVGGDQQVAGLDVAVHDPERVGRRDRVGGLRDQVGGGRRWHRLAVAEQRESGCPGTSSITR